VGSELRREEADQCINMGPSAGCEEVQREARHTIAGILSQRDESAARHGRLLCGKQHSRDAKTTLPQEPLAALYDEKAR
jgi:hypothetical protein